MNNTIEIIRYISNASVLVPIFMYVFKRKALSPSSHIIGALIITSVICDGISLFLFSKEISTVLVSNIYGVLLFSLLSWFFFELLTKESFNKNHRIIFFAGSTIYLICLIITLIIQGFFQYQDLLRSFGGIILVVYSIVYFDYMRKAQVSRLNGSLWFVGGITFYFAMSIGIFVLFQYLIGDTKPDVMRAIWSIHNVSNTLKNIAFAIGFYYSSKTLLKTFVKTDNTY
jgi:hypothetical protein